MTIFAIKSVSLGLLLLLAAPQMGVAQPTGSCLNTTYDQFRQEIDARRAVNSTRGDDYIVAYGWIKAVQVCIDFTTFPQPGSPEVRNFAAKVANTVSVLENAIRTNTQAQLIIGMSVVRGDPNGVDGNLYVFPKTIPGRDDRPSGTRPPQNETGYRMLSMDEWMRVQARLSRMGHSTGGIDGIVGPMTYAAIRRYQRTLGVPTSGVLTSAQLDDLLR